MTPRSWLGRLRRNLRPALRAADYAFAVRRQARALLGALRGRRPTAFALGAAGGAARGRAADAAPGTPVVLLPGVYETWRFLEPLGRHLRAAGHPVHVVSSLGLNRRPVADGADRVGRYLRERGLTGVVLVAHSKGGLVGKAVMLTDAGSRVAGMVAVATPWSGSVYARLFPPRSAVRALSPRDRHIRALLAERAVNDRIIALAPSWDPHIPGTGELEGARRSERLATAGHFRVLGHTATRTAVARAVIDLAAG